MQHLKCIIVVQLTLLFIVGFSTVGFSQKSAGRHFPTAKFGVLDTLVTSSFARNKPSATWQQFLSDTRLSCLEPGCKVTSFTISFLPKGEEFQGPYKTAGSELRDETVNMVKAKLMGNPKCRVFIEAIHVDDHGRDVQLPYAQVFTVTN
jgi:hypothetical protein